MLPDIFLTRPIAHRALHDRAAGRIENSRAACAAAVAAGYGIEIDLQLSSDGVAMVFHDDHLSRLTPAEGPTGARTAEELGTIPLTGATPPETIPTLAEILALVDGAVPLLIEIKDQDGALGPAIGPLERATLAALQGYGGPVALMSFNPHSVALLAQLAPDLPRGLVTEDFAPVFWPDLPEARGRELATIPDLERSGAQFVSHSAKDLGNPALARVRAAGLPILTWTIRSPAAEAEARRVADNVTFEGYLPEGGQAGQGGAAPGP